MIGNLHGPWLPVLALLLALVAARRGPRPTRRDIWVVAALTCLAIGLRWKFGLWGPLHVNGQGPLWIRGAIEDHALIGYGPGYFELLGWLTRMANTSWLAGWVKLDVTVFAANVVFSSLGPGLLYSTARLAGASYVGCLGAGLVLAVDPVSVRMAASEAYISALALLWLSTSGSLALALRCEARGQSIASAAAFLAAALFAAAATRIHPMIYLPLTLTPLLAFAAVQAGGMQERIRHGFYAALVIGGVALLTSLDTILTALAVSPMTSHAFLGFGAQELQLLLGALMAVLLLQWRFPSAWLGLLSIAALAALLATQGSFQQHPFWKLSYQRVYLPAVLLGATWLLPSRLRATPWAIVAASAVVVALAVPARDLVEAPTTEQLEYRFLQRTLGEVPSGCAVAAVSRVEHRIWEIPSFLVPSRDQRMPAQRALQEPNELKVLSDSGDCLIYIHSSLCNSMEGRELCTRIEAAVPMQRLAVGFFPAAPSYVGLPYDRDQVEVAVFRVGTHAATAANTGTASSTKTTLSDGAPITPELARRIFELVAPLSEADGCSLSHFDTGRFRISAGIKTAAGNEHAMEIATASGGAARTDAGDWALAIPDELAADCALTVTAFKEALARVATPQGSAFGPASSNRVHPTVVLLATSFLLLVMGTIYVLGRELLLQRPAWASVVSFSAVTSLAMTVRLVDSPRTFLHEYFHIAETISAYLTGPLAPVYGNTGPALFRLVALLTRSPGEVQVVFLTNAVLSALAIPALILFDYQRQGSWPRALAAGVLLCVLPLHQRFSAAEDLFVLAVTFALWSLALLANYLRTRRLQDALLAALALSLAVQARPEMLLFPGLVVVFLLAHQPKPWRVLLAWPTLAALGLLALLLLPRALELQTALQDSPSPGLHLPAVTTYLRSLVLFDPAVTPPLYMALVAIGLVWGVWRQPRYYTWLVLAFLAMTLFSQSLFNNPIYNVRSQVLPTSFTVLLAAGAASAWLDLWPQRRRLGLILGAVLWLGVSGAMWVGSRGFVHEMRDQQLEWAFLQRTVPILPQRANLLTAVEVGGHKINGFPQFLLTGTGKTYDLVDVRDAAAGRVAWPAPGREVLFYQGMFCHFAFAGEPRPQPLTPPCTAVHERYITEPLYIEDIPGPGYSLLNYAGDGKGPFRVGFYKLTAVREGESPAEAQKRRGR